MKFCDNPRCEFHQDIADPFQTYMVIALPVMDWPAGKMPVLHLKRMRFQINAVIEGVKITGFFCETCSSAIQLAKGWA